MITMEEYLRKEDPTISINELRALMLSEGFFEPFGNSLAVSDKALEFGVAEVASLEVVWEEHTLAVFCQELRELSFISTYVPSTFRSVPHLYIKYRDVGFPPPKIFDFTLRQLGFQFRAEGGPHMPTRLSVDSGLAVNTVGGAIYWSPHVIERALVKAGGRIFDIKSPFKI